MEIFGTPVTHMTFGVQVGLLAVLAKGCYSSAQYVQLNSEMVPGNK